MSKTEILYCSKCKKFTLQKLCPSCNEKTVTPKPGKYSPEDPYSKYRKIAKEN